MKPIVSAIVIHWNNPTLLKKMLKQLSKSRQIQTIVVDNDSDQKPSWIKKEFPSATLVQNGSNLGYAKACNKGAKKANGEWLLFLNDDLQIDEGQILTLIEYCEKNLLDAGSPLSSSSGYEKSIPTVSSLLLEFTPLGKIVKPSPKTEKTLFGGCLLIKQSVFKKLEGWDEDFYFWFEDSDLTKRLYENGFRVGWIPVKVNHIGGESLGRYDEKKRRVMFFTSMSTYARKHFSLVGRFIVGLIRLRYTFL